MRALRAIALTLILLGLPPTVHAQEKTTGDLDVEDSPGDVFLGPESGGGFLPGLPASAATDDIDLRHLRVHDESVDGLHISVALQTFDKSPANIQGRTIYVRFSAQTNPPVDYQLRWNAFSSFLSTNTTPTMVPYFCAGIRGHGCIGQHVRSAMAYDTHTLDAYIEKSALRGLVPLGQQPGVDGIQLPLGSQLVNFTVTASDSMFTDRLPDSGTAGPYFMKMVSANDRIRVGPDINETQPETSSTSTTASAPPPPSPSGTSSPPPTTSPTSAAEAEEEEKLDFSHIPVEPGTVFSVPLKVENRNGARRILNLSVEFDHPKDADKWQLRIAPTLQLPGNESRVVNLLINATAKVQHREETTVRVVAKALGFPDEVGSATLTLVATVPPSVERKTLYFHQQGFDDQSVLAPCSIPLLGGCTGHLFLSTAKDDALGTADEQVAGSSGILFIGTQRQGFAGFALEEKLGRDVVLDPKVPIQSTIKLGGQGDYSGTLEIRIQSGDVYVGGAQIPFTTTSQPIEATFVPLLDGTRLPAGSLPRVDLIITVDATPTSAVALAGELGVIAKDSQITLPIIPDDKAVALPNKIGDSFVGLKVRGDGDDFVNPGESRAFNLTLVNESNSTEAINVTGILEKGPCSLQIRPGQRFRLEGGDSVHLGALVHAAGNAKEGDRCRAIIQAGPESDPDSITQVALDVVVTDGLDLPNDAENYTADQESASKVDAMEGSSRTPGPTFVIAVAAAVAALRLRRRPRDP